MIRRRLLPVLAALGLVAALSPLLAHGAGAGSAIVLNVTTNATGGQPQATFDWAVSNGLCLSGTTVVVTGVPDAVITINTPNNGTITMPLSAPGGLYQVHVECTTDSGAGEGNGTIAFARILVDKVVTGEAPPGMQFEIEIACEGLDRSASAALPTEGGGAGPTNGTLVYGATGGTQSLIGYIEELCRVTETDAVAPTVTITTENCGEIGPPKSGGEGVATDPDQFLVFQPVDCTQTVTNDFLLPDDDTPDTLPDVVTATPTLTG